MAPDAQVDFGQKPALKKALLLFVFLTLVLSFAASLLVIDIGIKRYYMGLLMWMPGISALIACKIFKIDFGALGWGWGKARWQVLAYFTPIIYGLLAYCIIWMAGYGGVPDGKFIEESGYHLCLVGWIPTATVVMAFLMFGGVGIIWHISSALGEEIGWRGFLMPALMHYVSFPLAALGTGLLWSLWHLPIILYTSYNAGPSDMGLQIANFMLLTVSMSFIMGYLRLKSGSLWTATLMHAAHNTYILGLFARLTVQYDESWRYVGEFGTVLPLVTAAFALYFWFRAHKVGLGSGRTVAAQL